MTEKELEDLTKLIDSEWGLEVADIEYNTSTKELNIRIIVNFKELFKTDTRYSYKGTFLENTFLDIEELKSMNPILLPIYDLKVSVSDKKIEISDEEDYYKSYYKSEIYSCLIIYIPKLLKKILFK